MRVARAIGSGLAVVLFATACQPEPVFEYRRIEQPDIRVRRAVVMKANRLLCEPKIELHIDLAGVGLQKVAACEKPDLELRGDEIETTRIVERASLLAPDQRYYSLLAALKAEPRRRFEKMARVRGAVPMAVSTGPPTAYFASPMGWSGGVELGLFASRAEAESLAARLGQEPRFEPLDEERLRKDLESFQRAMEGRS